MSLIAEQSGIPYPTTRRIVHALINEGMVEREAHRKRYRPTALVNSLSVGYQAEDRLDDLAWPLLVELTRVLARVEVDRAERPIGPNDRDNEQRPAAGRDQALGVERSALQYVVA